MPLKYSLSRYRDATLPGNLEFDNSGKKKKEKNLEL